MTERDVGVYLGYLTENRPKIAARLAIVDAAGSFDLHWAQGSDRCVITRNLELEGALVLKLSGLALDHTQGALRECVEKVRRRGRGRYEILQGLMPPEGGG